jgi:release factor glutamine methyltransferase
VARTLGSILGEAAEALASAGFGEPRRRARRLVAAALDISPAELLASAEEEIESREAARISMLLGRMLDHEPLTRIIGRREFWGLDFALSADTLDPRPESETVVEAVLRRVADRSEPIRVLDLGTGTGCLLLSLLSEMPAATGIGIDIASGAIATARRNAAALGLTSRAGFLVGDWAEALSARFAAVVANPPYVPSAALSGLPCEVNSYDPWRALDGGVDGLAAYRAIAADLPRLLAPEGLFAAEVGADQADFAAAILRAEGLSIDAIERDLAGIARCVIARRQFG